MKAYYCENCKTQIGPRDVRKTPDEDYTGVHEGGCGGTVNKIPQADWYSAGASARLQVIPDSTMFLRTGIADAETEDGVEVMISAGMGGGIILEVEHPDVESGSFDGRDSYIICTRELARAAIQAFRDRHSFVCTGCERRVYGEPADQGEWEDGREPKRYQYCEDCDAVGED